MDTSLDFSAAAQKVAAAQSGSGDLFGMSFWGIAAAVVFSGIGLIYVKYGKTTGNTAMMVCGVLLLGYSYFCSNTAYLIAAGAGLALWPHLYQKF